MASSERHTVIVSDEENIIVPSSKKSLKRIVIESDEEILSSDGKEEEDIEVESEDDAEDDDEESVSAEDDDDDDLSNSDAVEDEDDDDESDADSILTLDSEFSWDEFDYIEDNAASSFILDEEESLKDRYNAAMKLLLSEQAEEGFDSLTILYEEPLIQKQLTSDLANFDWNKAKSTFVKSCEPKIKMIAFGVCRALARFAKDPTVFYFHALTLRPNDRALWYEFGCAAAKLHDWKTSELAFKQCPNDPDSKVKLAIVYFYSKDYHKCLPLLREILTSRPNNIAALVLKAEISKLNKFWHFYVELYFPSNLLFFPNPELPKDVHDKVLKEIEALISTVPPSEKFQASYSLESLPAEPVRLNLEQSMETFAIFLCSYFDQSSRQQLPYHQTVHFAKEKRRHVSRNFNSSAMSGSIRDMDVSQDVEMLDDSLNVCNDIEASCSQVMDDSIKILEDVEAVVKKLVNDVATGRIPKIAKPKRKPPKKKPQPIEIENVFIRRSTRRADEIPFEAIESPVIGTAPIINSNSEAITIRTFLGLPPDITFPPLDFPGGVGYPLEELTCQVVPSFTLETFGTFLMTLLNRQHVPMEELLRSFLLFFAYNLPEGCKLTNPQQKLYLEVYIRWLNTFCQPLYQQCLNASVSDLSIHLLALELDVERKLPAEEAFEIYLTNICGLIKAPIESDVLPAEPQRIEDTSDKALRKRAITLLAEVDSEMAARVRSCIEQTRSSSKAVTRESNVEAAIESFGFLRDNYRPKIQKPKIPKTKPADISVDESQDKAYIENIASEEKIDPSTLQDLGICHPSTSESPASIEPLPDITIKFIKLWSDASKIMQRIKRQKSRRSSPSRQAIRDLSPMDESDMLSLLTEECPDENDEVMIIGETMKTMVEKAHDHKNLKNLMEEYLISLQNFVNNFKFKKDISEDSVKDFLEETRSMVEAIKAVQNDAIPHNDDMDYEDNEDEKLRELVIRYYWLKVVQMKDDDEEAVERKKAYLTTMLYLMDSDKPVYSQIPNDEGKHRVVTVKDVVKMLTDIFRNEKRKNIQKLLEENKHQEVISQFTTDFNWQSCSEKEIVSNLRILLTSFQAVQDRKGPVEWICRLLDRVISGKFEIGRDEIYINCLLQLENLDLENIDHDLLTLIAKRLVVCAEYDRFKKNIKLWKLLYRLVTIFEGSYDNEEKRQEMYQEFDSYSFILPTKGLSLLAEAHRELGEEKYQCCTMNNGELLYFFIDELYKNYHDHRFADHYYSKIIQRNVELQLIQCLKCLFDSSIAKSAVYDHKCTLNLTPTLSIARKVTPFLVPRLPMFDDERFTTNDVIDALTRVFPFIEDERLPGFDEARAQFDTFLENPPFFLFSSENDKLIPKGDNIEAAYEWPSVELTEDNREKLELFAYVRYTLLVIKFKKQNYSWEEHEKLRQLVRECLVLVGPAHRKLLPLQIIHSLWALCAYTHTMHVCALEDEELAKYAHTYFYMFKMAFLHYSQAFQLHIDIAVAYYQMDARIRRYKRHINNPLPSDVEAKIEREEMINQCQLHFQTFRHSISQTNEYPKDISWIEPYFTGKIAEKKKSTLKEVFNNYHRCAMLMRAEAYTYPLRVNKTQQENVEPLEIHYRVHVYAMKQIFDLDKLKSMETKITNLKIIRYYLRLFLGHFIFAKKHHQAPIPPVETKYPFIDSTPTCDFEEPPSFDEDYVDIFDDDFYDIQDTIDMMTTLTDLKLECLELCRRAFETIVRRFPHYKSYYRLALLHYTNQEYSQALDIILSKLLKGKFQSIDKITTIERTDIERSETNAYHITKLIKLTTVLIGRCQDIPKALAFLEALCRKHPYGEVKVKESSTDRFISYLVDVFKNAVDLMIKGKRKHPEKLAAILKPLEKAAVVLRNGKKHSMEERVKQIISKVSNIIQFLAEADEQRKLKEAEILKQTLREADRQRKELFDKMQALAREAQEQAERKKQIERDAKKYQQVIDANRQLHQLIEARKVELEKEAAKKKKEEEEKKAKQKQAEEMAKKLVEAEKKKQQNALRAVAIARYLSAINESTLTADKKMKLIQQQDTIVEICMNRINSGDSIDNVFNQIHGWIKGTEKDETTTGLLSSNKPQNGTAASPIILDDDNTAPAKKLQPKQHHPASIPSISSVTKAQNASTSNPSTSTPRIPNPAILSGFANALAAYQAKQAAVQTSTSQKTPTPKPVQHLSKPNTSSPSPRPQQSSNQQHVITAGQNLNVQQHRASAHPTPPSKPTKASNGTPSSHPSTPKTHQNRLPQLEPQRASAGPTPPTKKGYNGASKPTQRPPIVSNSQPRPFAPSVSASQVSSSSTPIPNDPTTRGQRELVIAQIEDLFKRYDPDNLKKFHESKTILQQKPIHDLNQLYSDILVKYIVKSPNKSPAAPVSNPVKRPANDTPGNNATTPKQRKLATPILKSIGPGQLATKTSSTPTSMSQMMELVRKSIPPTPKAPAKPSSNDDIIVIGEKRPSKTPTSTPSTSMPQKKPSKPTPPKVQDHIDAVVNSVIKQASTPRGPILLPQGHNTTTPPARPSAAAVRPKVKKTKPPNSTPTPSRSQVPAAPVPSTQNLLSQYTADPTAQRNLQTLLSSSPQTVELFRNLMMMNANNIPRNNR